MNSHTFLLRPGTWTARGEYADARGRATPAQGETRVLHEPDQWVIKGTLVLPDQGAKYFNTYAITPLGEDRDWTEFTCNNLDLGFFSGILVFYPEIILSSFTAASGMHGMESLLQKDERTYESRGALLSATAKIGSWTMLLTAVQD